MAVRRRSIVQVTGHEVRERVADRHEPVADRGDVVRVALAREVARMAEAAARADRRDRRRRRVHAGGPLDVGGRPVEARRTGLVGRGDRRRPDVVALAPQPAAGGRRDRERSEGGRAQRGRARHGLALGGAGAAVTAGARIIPPSIGTIAPVT